MYNGSENTQSNGESLSGETTEELREVSETCLKSYLERKETKQRDRVNTNLVLSS
jgi:hypothetical protein